MKRVIRGGRWRGLLRCACSRPRFIGVSFAPCKKLYSERNTYGVIAFRVCCSAMSTGSKSFVSAILDDLISMHCMGQRPGVGHIYGVVAMEDSR